MAVLKSKLQVASEFLPDDTSKIDSLSVQHACGGGAYFY